MKNKQIFTFAVTLLLALPALLLCGCSNSDIKHIDLDRFDVYANSTPETMMIGDELLYVYGSQDAEISINMFGYQGILILPLYIKNKTGQDIATKEYTITLHDGKDRLPIQQLTQTDLRTIRGKDSGSQQGLNLLSPTLQGAMSTVDSLLKLPGGDSSVQSSFDFIVDRYFSLRPIYANTTRAGFLTFYHNFRLEFPVVLEITIKSEKHSFYFMPKAKKSK